MYSESTIKLAEALADNLLRLDDKLVTAESCTGGGLAEILTCIPGSSAWFERGFVTYSNEAKMELLQVNQHTLEQWGAVSEETATEMVSGAIANSHAQYGVSITGIAGPGGGTEEKPVGTVCLAWQHQSGEVKIARVRFDGDRLQIREQACLLALQGLLDMTGANCQ